MNVYVGIGNSDDKLTQTEWSDFVREVEATLSYFRMHGSWFSRPDARWQNACWLVEALDPENNEKLKAHLRNLAKRYRQDSIAWAVAETEFLRPEGAAACCCQEAT